MTVLSWDEVRARVSATGPKGAKVWGVPRGGSIIASLLVENGCSPVDFPDDADVLVDDIVDSGETRGIYHDRFPGKPFWAPYIKQEGDAWICFPWEQDEESGGETNVRRILQSLGENVNRDGLRDTPSRVIRALREMTAGARIDPRDYLSTVFEEGYDEMVVVRDIEFWSLCEHHLLPFHGTATVGYIPNGRVVGLSKIPRVVRAFARRLQVQERMTQQIAQAMMDGLCPAGVGVIVSSLHTCMAARGVGVQAPMVTSYMSGSFRENPAVRAEFMAMARKG